MTYNLNYISPQMRAILQPAIENSHFSHKELNVLSYQDAYIMPFYKWRESIGGVATKEGVAIVDSRNAEWEESFVPFMNQQYHIEHKKVIYLGVLVVGFGHCFTDDLRKLWFLKTEQCKLLLKEGAELVYTTDLNQPLPIHTKQILQYAGFDYKSATHITELTCFDEVLVPDNSFYAESFGRCYTKEYVASVDDITQSINQISCAISVPKKIYLSRSKFSKRPESRSEQGEEIIEKQMRKIGFTSIIPEEYSFAEQVYMVRHCEQLATTEGSVAHIAVFCRPQTKLFIFCKARYLNFHQVAINQVGNLDVTYIEAHHSLKMSKDIPWYGPFYLCVTKYFEDFLEYKVPHVPFFLRLSFWKYMRVVPRTINKIYQILKIDKRL